MSSKGSGSYMMGFQTRAVSAGTIRAGAVTSLPEEPQSLWPSGRGTEIGTAAMSFPQLLARVKRLAKTATWRASVFIDPGEGCSALILEGLAGQKTITLVAEDHLAKDIVAVVADIAADPIVILRAISALVGPAATLTQSPPERLV
jgi:hypothetical protein